jgi:hypothetical protein
MLIYGLIQVLSYYEEVVKVQRLLHDKAVREDRNDPSFVNAVMRNLPIDGTRSYS